jgi:hypothetical protein
MEVPYTLLHKPYEILRIPGFGKTEIKLPGIGEDGEKVKL